MYILKLVVCTCLSVAIIVGLTVYVRLMLNIMRNWRDDKMIELTNIKTTDTVRQLRGQINTMQNEIMDNQPFVGRLVNPSINYYSTDGDNYTLVATNTAMAVQSSLTALCFPESNGVFVAGVWGMIKAMAEPQYVGPDRDYMVVSISVPAIKLATMTDNISTFVSCEHLGLPNVGAIPGLTTKPVQANITDIMFVNSNNSTSQVTPAIEQGDNICNIIFVRSV